STVTVSPIESSTRLASRTGRLARKASQAPRTTAPTKTTSRTIRRRNQRMRGVPRWKDGSGGRLDAIDALQSAWQQAAARRAVAAVFDEVRPAQDQLALAGV